MTRERQEVSGPPPHQLPEPGEPRQPFWTRQRRDALGDAVIRLGCAGLFLVATVVSMGLVVLSQIDFVEPGRSSQVWTLWLVPVAVLFACSVAPLVAGDPPRWLRVVGNVYAIAGTVFLGGLLFDG